ncbi:hypothetical protein [Legionella impletisoli]|uniref:Uncharacterized protein n=1 Tax=Legionella impletisoli TaxID=343510 RepID=A0A917JXW8_9GAMM|nr:hypothetical protein [Legionella impletisoli]GGI89427.1 hypothetical protein GCM10007966_17680 [Legionella impletisoli]
MTKSTLSELFGELGQTPEVIHTKPGSRALRKDVTLQIYPLAQLHELLTVLKGKTQDDDEDDYKIRYLLDTKFNLWFGLEGFPGSEVPAHYQMTGEKREEATCFAAGNIQFSRDFTTIEAINNKSGDFQPPFQSIQWALAVLIHNLELSSTTIRLADELCIESAAPIVQHRFTLDDVRQWVRLSFSEKLEAFSLQPTVIKTCPYEAPHRRVEPDDPRAQKMRSVSPFSLDAGLSLFCPPSFSSLPSQSGSASQSETPSESKKTPLSLSRPPMG